MKCEHAQEFFSDYIEHSLDKPGVVALEAHLTACQGCRRGVEGLRQTWDALRAVPVIEPPKDLAWKVITQLQRERLEQLEAERKRVNPFVAWLQSLTPGGAFGYATLVALLLIALAFPLGGLDRIIEFNPFRVNRAAPVNVNNGSQAGPQSLPIAPRVTVEGPWQDARTQRWYYGLVITPATELGMSSAKITPYVSSNGQLQGTEPSLHRQTLLANQPWQIPVEAMVGGERVQSVSLELEVTGFRPYVTMVSLASNGQRPVRQR
jgi:hypothetical protein